MVIEILPRIEPDSISKCKWPDAFGQTGRLRHLGVANKNGYDWAVFPERRLDLNSHRIRLIVDTSGAACGSSEPPGAYNND
jgi:hypothetical protein